MNIRLAFLTALICLAALPARAQGGIDELVRIEVIDGGRTADGRYLAGLRIVLADGWKTYWRAPGEAGIPPQLSWNGSRNVGAVDITWPTPLVFDQSGIRTIGYKDELVLPLTITPDNDGKPVRLAGEIDFGICSDVCVPAYLSFDHQIDRQAGRNPAIAAALAQRPYSADEAKVANAACLLEPTADGIEIEARIDMPSAGGTEIAVIETGNPELWVLNTESRRSGGAITASGLIEGFGGGSMVLDRSQIRITVLGQSYAVDIRGCAAG